MASHIHGLQLNTVTPSPALLAPQTLDRRSPKSVEYRRSRRRDGLVACRSSLVGEQQEASPFTDPETQLIEALIGIQGRGRSATPQQLQVIRQFGDPCLFPRRSRVRLVFAWLDSRSMCFFRFWCVFYFGFLQDVERAVAVLETLAGVPDPVHAYFHS